MTGLRIEPTPQPDASARGVSGRDELRAVYNAIDNPSVQTKVFDVPGSNAAIRYRRLGLKESTQALDSEGELWERNAQFLITACEEILIRNPDTGELEPIVEGERVTFDLRPGESVALHQALGENETDIRRSVLRLFQGADRVLVMHAAHVDAWMDTLQKAAREKFAGG
jgi:hypothetical protein